ncbi:ABC transporter permease [Rhodopirellula sp. SM50]|nr:ABC transporter permease [Rhodopirellula sp. SM50]PAY18934.1 ABC transporter permease [Rhodopirellula sp. SM50]
MMSLRRVAALAIKEVREITRDRLLFTLAFLLPPLMMVVIGFGVNTDVREIPIVVLDFDRTHSSRELAYKFRDSQYFDFVGYVEQERQIQRLITDNQARAAIVIPPKFHEQLRSGQPASVQTIIDGSIPPRAETVGGYVASVIASFSHRQVTDQLARTRGITPSAASALANPISLETRFLYNEAMTSRWAIGPGCIMTVLAFIPPILASVGVVREKESGSIDNVYSSTLTRPEFVLGKLIPYVLISSISFFVLFATTLLVFQVPFRGSPIAFSVTGILYVTCTTMMGIIISFFVRSQIAAVILAVLITLIPTLQYSGMIVPLSSLSDAGQIQARMLPASYFYEAIQASFLKGTGFAGLQQPIAALLVYSLVLYALCCLKFSKRPKS